MSRRHAGAQRRAEGRRRPRGALLQWTLGLCALALPLVPLSCRRAPLPGEAELPPGVARVPGLFADIGPRWSHDGRRIAFLRRTTDRRLQLCIASRDLSRVTPVLQPEIVSPDRPYRTGWAGYRAPEGPAWSPDDRVLAFSRVEWFTFEDGERLPGAGLWACDVTTRTARPLAIHPKRYEGLFYYYRSPRWSPDGRRLAFVGEGVHGETTLFVRTLPGTGPRLDMPRYDQYTDEGWPAWSPDGRRLVFRQGILRAFTADPLETLRLIAPGGTEARRLFATSPVRYLRLVNPGLTERQLKEAQDALGASFPAGAPRISGLCFSPDGLRLAFAIAWNADDLTTCSLWTLNVDAPGPPTLIPLSSPSNDRGYLAPVWIDNETLGALRAPGLRGEGYDAVAISLRPAPGANSPVRMLCELPSDDIDWSPDRRLIVCAVPQKGRPAASTTLRVFPTGISPAGERGQPPATPGRAPAGSAAARAGGAAAPARSP